jgi:hypothetical protein
MWLVAVVGRCIVGCEHCEGFCSTLFIVLTSYNAAPHNHYQPHPAEPAQYKHFTVLTSYNAAPHNRYQPHPAEPEQYTRCSNTVFFLLKMGIMMPETMRQKLIINI